MPTAAPSGLPSPAGGGPAEPDPAASMPALPESTARGRLGAGEAAVVIAAIAAVTTLAVLERPVPAVLTALASAAGLLLVPARLRTILACVVGGSRQ